jgi:hypothetical protein
MYALRRASRAPQAGCVLRIFAQEWCAGAARERGAQIAPASWPHSCWAWTDAGSGQGGWAWAT